MKWPLRYPAPNGMIIPAIPYLRTGMPDYGMQACDLKKININT
jgi:hypothetical protein